MARRVQPVSLLPRTARPSSRRSIHAKMEASCPSPPRGHCDMSRFVPLGVVLFLAASVAPCARAQDEQGAIGRGVGYLKGAINQSQAGEAALIALAMNK